MDKARMVDGLRLLAERDANAGASGPALADTVIDLATEVILSEARRRLQPIVWRLVPRF